jgi:hypothetical protein
MMRTLIGAVPFRADVTFRAVELIGRLVSAMPLGPSAGDNHGARRFRVDASAQTTARLAAFGIVRASAHSSSRRSTGGT